MAKAQIALYGNVKIPRAYCEDCGGMSLIVRRRFACCDAPFADQPAEFKRMSMPAQVRILPPLEERRRILKEQDDRCLYCLYRFGAFIRRQDGRNVRVRLCWDHMVPFVYSQNNHTQNFAAACTVCNGIKSAHYYQTIEEARHAIQAARKTKGYPSLY